MISNNCTMSYISTIVFCSLILFLIVRCKHEQVQWDEPSSIIRPDRVSPWEVEPLVSATPPSSQPLQRKRARPPISPSGASDHRSEFGMGITLLSPFIDIHVDSIITSLVYSSEKNDVFHFFLNLPSTVRPVSLPASLSVFYLWIQVSGIKLSSLFHFPP